MSSKRKEDKAQILKLIGRKFRKTYADFDSSDSESDSGIDFDISARIWDDLYCHGSSI